LNSTSPLVSIWLSSTLFQAIRSPDTSCVISVISSTVFPAGASIVHRDFFSSSFSTARTLSIKSGKRAKSRQRL